LLPDEGIVLGLHGLPPTFIDVGESKICRDECVAYASKLWVASVSTELHVWPGAFHGFDLNLPKTAISRTAKTTRSAWVYRWLRRSQASSELIVIDDKDSFDAADSVNV
jgi:acetyl esterase/lipase